MNPYRKFVSDLADLVSAGKSLPLGGLTRPARPAPPAGAPVALIFSPHPDDECIIGGLALRLMREAGFRVVNVAVTQGSNKQRRAARLEELKNACVYLGFDLETIGVDGLEGINLKARAEHPAVWSESVKTIALVLAKHQPRTIFFPHELDWNSSHVGTHSLVTDALKTMPQSFQSTLVETEFWGQMPAPNLMVESSLDDVADLLAALSFHVGEVQRNPYHLRLPAWLQDNVRRGAELVGGQGAAAPDFTFATLYRVRQWKRGGIEKAFEGGKQIGRSQKPDIV